MQHQQPTPLPLEVVKEVKKIDKEKIKAAKKGKIILK